MRRAGKRTHNNTITGRRRKHNPGGERSGDAIQEAKRSIPFKPHRTRLTDGCGMGAALHMGAAAITLSGCCTFRKRTCCRLPPPTSHSQSPHRAAPERAQWRQREFVLVWWVSNIGLILVSGSLVLAAFQRRYSTLCSLRVLVVAFWRLLGSCFSVFRLF